MICNILGKTCNVNNMIGISIIKFGEGHQKKKETNCLIKLTGKFAKLKCSEFSSQENREIKMQ